MVKLGAGEHIHIGDVGNNHIYVEFTSSSESSWGNGTPTVTLHYMLIIHNCGDYSYYNQAINGEYYPSDMFPGMADWTSISHTKDERLESLANHVKEHALKGAEDIISGRSKTKPSNEY